MWGSLRIALRNLWRRPTRSLLAVFGMSVSLVLAIGLIAFSFGLRKLVDDTLQQVTGLMVLARGAPHPYLSLLPIHAADGLAADPDVAVIVPQVWHPVITLEGTLLLKTDLAGGALGVLGLDPIHQRRLPGGGLFQRRLVAGRFFAEGEHDAAVLSVAAARNLKLELGSALRLPGLDALRVVGLFDGGSRLFDLVVVVDINQARRLKQIDTGRVSSFFVEVADPRRAEALAARIDRDYPALRAFTPDALGALAGDLLSKLDKILLVITILPLLGAAAAVANTMMMSFSERIAEFGVLMACGWRRADVLQLVIAEASLLGLAGGLVGALLGAFATAGLASYLAVEPVTPWWLHGACILLAVMLGAAGGLYPAWRAARLSPMEAIRHHG